MVDWCWVRLLSAFKSGRIYSNLGAYNAVNNGLGSRCMVRKVPNSGKKILSLFVAIFTGVNECISQNSCLLRLVFEDSLVSSHK